MSKTNAFETDFAELVFNDVDLAGIGDATGLQGDPSSAGSLYAALFTVTPTESTPGTECSYGSYARVAIARSGAGWTIAGNNTSNTGVISFPTSTSGSETAVAVGIMAASSGTVLMYYNTLDSSISITVGVQPQFLANTLDVNES